MTDGIRGPALRRVLLLGLLAVGLAALAAQQARASFPLATNGRIVFQRDVGGKGHVWLMNADGSGAVDISPPDTFGDEDPQFSPDGRWIVLTRWLDGSGGLLHVFKMHPDGSGAVDLTPGL